VIGGNLRLTFYLVSISTLATGCSYQPTKPAKSLASVTTIATKYALQMVGAPYRYGGSTPRGFDCSGLVHYSYARAGVTVPRTTRQQRKYSRPVARRNIRRGDLLFFNQSGKRSSHVGLYIGNNQFVHAPSTGKTVYVASLTSRYWRRYFIGARRFDLNR
jgi:murein DD-endopeptidase